LKKIGGRRTKEGSKEKIIDNCSNLRAKKKRDDHWSRRKTTVRARANVERNVESLQKSLEREKPKKEKSLRQNQRKKLEYLREKRSQIQRKTHEIPEDARTEA